MSNISSDLVWEICRPNNAYLVKRKSGGGVQLSRDPLNLVNKHSLKHSGFINDQAIGILPADKGGVTLTTKKQKHINKPASASHHTSWGSNKSSRKTYAGIVSSTAKRNYRPDLRSEAVARASAIRRSQRTAKDTPEKTPRGAKARKATEDKTA